ncbi:MAG: hypothetical protein GC206_14905 [Alphaproteobacteria bacterium]|nr:hypothetical protein [Alphaproteobacteria bacterium]
MALAALFDKRKRAQAQARFRAWWDGVAYAPAPEDDAGAAEADAQPTAREPAAAVASEPHPRIAARERMWGTGRTRPGDDTAEGLLAAMLNVAPTAPIEVMGAGLAAPLLNLARTHQGAIVAHEWREETLAPLRAALSEAGLSERVSVKPIDLDTYAPAAESVDALVSFDEFTYAANAPRLAAQITKALKPGAPALIEAYTAIPNPEIAPAFATGFAEHHVRPTGDLQDLFAEAGLTVESAEDVTEEHLACAREGFARLAAAIESAVGEGLSVRMLQEAAWEAAAWKARMRLMTRQRLERRRFLARKPSA